MYQLDQVTLKRERERRELGRWCAVKVRMRRGKSDKDEKRKSSGHEWGVGEGICVKFFHNTFLSTFSSQFGRIKKVGLGEKTFSLVLCLSYFPSPTKQWKTTFSTLFSSLYFPSSLFSHQPNTPLVKSSDETTQGLRGTMLPQPLKKKYIYTSMYIN